MNLVDNVAIAERAIQNDRIRVNFPIIQGLSDLQIQSKINDKIQDSLYKMIWNHSYDREVPLVDGSYRVMLNRSGIISLLVELNLTMPDRLNSRKLYKSFTFNIRDGVFYKFADLFKNDSDFIGRINKLIKRQILEKGVPLQKKFKTITEDEKFYLTPAAVVIYNSSHEYTLPDYGLLEFTIRLEDVQELIYSKGPLGR